MPSAGQTTARERRHERTRQAILDAARKIIVQEGTAALSMRAIAQHIDYSAAGLYEYFDGKEAIVAAVCQQGHRRLTEYMQRVDPLLPPDEYLLEIGLAYIDFAVHNPDFFLLMFSSTETAMPADMPPDVLLDQMQQEGSSFPLLLGAIRRGIDAGLFRPRPGYGATEMALTAWGMVHGLAMLRIGNLKHFPGYSAAMEREALRRIGLGLAAG